MRTGITVRFPKEYNSWKSMLRRCLKPTDASYKYVGGRGFTVCDRWRHSFANFLADMGRAPSKRHSIDRRDNDDGYHPGNCRWATPTEQMRNSRNAVFIEHDGLRLCISEWSERTGLPASTILQRLSDGKSHDEIFSTARLPNHHGQMFPKSRDTMYSKNSSGYRGVAFHKKSGKWQARVRIENKHFYLGVFDTPEAAGGAVSAKINEHKRAGDRERSGDLDFGKVALCH